MPDQYEHNPDVCRQYVGDRCLCPCEECEECNIVKGLE